MSASKPAAARANTRPAEPRPPGSRHLLECWPQVSRRLLAAERILLFLDFDGTLAPLRARPELVSLALSTQSVLRRLAAHPRVMVWIISGRRRADLRRRVNVLGIRYLGLHGWERRRGAAHADHTGELLRNVRRRLARRLRPLPGIWIEDKGLSFVVHYIGAASDAARRARSAVGEVLRPLQTELRVQDGKKVLEVLPREIEGKGAAVRALIAMFPGSTIPVYLGDDATDEPAFAALRHGLAVRVGRKRHTAARFHLRDHEEVRRFLERLERELA